MFLLCGTVPSSMLLRDLAFFEVFQRPGASRLQIKISDVESTGDRKDTPRGRVQNGMQMGSCHLHHHVGSDGVDLSYDAVI